MTHLRKMMLEELQRRNYSDRTATRLSAIGSRFAKHFGKPPDQLGPDELRSYQAYLLKERKLAVGTVIARVAGLALLFRPHPEAARVPARLAVSQEAAAATDGAESGGGRAADRCRGQPLQRAVLMTLYGTGMRRSEVSQLKVSRYRQPAHDHPRRTRQGRPRPRSAAQSGAAGNAA